MFVKLFTALALGAALMGSSRVIPVPIYVHCNLSDSGISAGVCDNLVQKLRDRKLNRSVARLKNPADRSGVGLHITLHAEQSGEQNVKSFLSWGAAGNEHFGNQSTGKTILISKQDLVGGVSLFLEKLIDGSEMPL